MTMQVGMVGTDGIVIAGDTRWTMSPQLQLGQLHAGGRYGYAASKFRFSVERGIVVACARKMERATHIATEVLTLSDEELKEPCDAICGIAKRIRQRQTDNQDDAHCLIAIAKPTPRMFLFQYGNVDGYLGEICYEMHETAFAGDIENAAIFWAERYYRPTTVRELIPLAAHLVVSSARLNTATIGGLELAVCDANGVHRVPAESVKQLAQQSRDWDRIIGEMFSAYGQQFSYAPDVIG